MRPARFVLSLSVLLLFLAACAVPARDATAAPSLDQGKIQIYLLRMDPTSRDAKEFTRASWGGGASVVAPVPQLGNLFAGVLGIDIANMLSEKTEFRDQLTGLRVEQQTNQSYMRFYLGGRVGPHGYGFVRPHVGSDIALVLYDITTDVVVPDDTDRQNEIRQNLRDETQAAFGWDVTAGVDFNFVNAIPVELGVRWLKSFNVPQQLGAGSVTVQPAYVQYYLAAGVSFGFMGRHGEK